MEIQRLAAHGDAAATCCGLNAPRHVHSVKAPEKKERKDLAARRKREAIYGTVRPQPVPRKANGALQTSTELSADEPPMDQQPPQSWKGPVGEEEPPSNQQPPHQWKGSDGEEIGEEGAAGMSRMSDWARRKWAKSRKAAVELRSSTAVLSEATKARFAH